MPQGMQCQDLRSRQYPSRRHAGMYVLRSMELEQASTEKGKIPVTGTTRTGRNWATFGESTVQSRGSQVGW